MDNAIQVSCHLEEQTTSTIVSGQTQGDESDDRHEGPIYRINWSITPSLLTTPVGLYPHVQRGLEIFKLSYNPRGYKSKSPKSIDIQMGTLIASSFSSKHLNIIGRGSCTVVCKSLTTAWKDYVTEFWPPCFPTPSCADRPSDFDFTYNPWGYKPINTVLDMDISNKLVRTHFWDHRLDLACCQQWRQSIILKN